MRYWVTDVQHHNEVDGSGYYPDHTPQNGFHKLVKFVQYPIAIKVDEVLATVYSTAENKWWLGATHSFNQAEFPLMGPYDTVETAVVFLRLLGEVTKLTY